MSHMVKGLAEQIVHRPNDYIDTCPKCLKVMQRKDPDMRRYFSSAHCRDTNIRHYFDMNQSGSTVETLCGKKLRFIGATADFVEVK